MNANEHRNWVASERRRTLIYSNGKKKINSTKIGCNPLEIAKRRKKNKNKKTHR